LTTWIDLSRPIVEGVPVYPGDPLFQARPFAEHTVDGFRGVRITFGSHLGTHIDAPYHYFVDGETLDDFPLDFFCGKAACLDLTETISNNAVASFGIPVLFKIDDLLPFEQVVESVDFLFLQTNWASKFGRPEFYSNFPSLSPEICEWLDDYANLRLLGLETPSLVSFPTNVENESVPELLTEKTPFDLELGDLLPTERKEPGENSVVTQNEQPLDELELCADAECHRILLGRRPPILILEGLVGLHVAPSFSKRDASNGLVAFDNTRTFEVACFPLPIVGLDGCPVRVAARVESSN